MNLAGQASEAEINTELVRILYRVFNNPTPDFQIKRNVNPLERNILTEKHESEKVIRRSKFQIVDKYVNHRDNAYYQTHEELYRS